MISLIPARYAKAITTLVGALITYIETIGPHWDLKAALLYIGLILGVGAVPNAATTATSPAATPPQRTALPPGQLPTS
jgi:hypothetical protein